MSDERASAYWEVGPDGRERAIVRASALGSACEQSLARALAGQPGSPPPDWMLEKYEQGKKAEGPILEALTRKYGWKVCGPEVLGLYGSVGEDGQVEMDLAVGRHAVRVHPDGVAVRLDGDWPDGAGDVHVGALAVVEAKALSQSMFEQWRRKGLDVVAPYRMQVAVEMHATGLPMVYVVGVKDDDGELIEDEVHARYYPEPPVSLVDISRRVLRIVRQAQAIEEGRGSPECEQVQFPCAFWQLPDTACGQRKEKAVVDDEVGIQLANLARQIDAKNQLIKRQEAARAELRAQVLELVGDDVSGAVDVPGWDLTVSRPTEGRVKWADLAEELMAEMAADERGLYVEKHRGKPARPSVTVKAKEET